MNPIIKITAYSRILYISISIPYLFSRKEMVYWRGVMKFFGTKIRKWLLQLTIFMGVIGLIFWVTLFVQENVFVQDFIARYGYVSIFAISLISGLNLIVPVPAISFLPLFLAAGLNLWPTLFILILGVTAADILSYGIGVFGRNIVISAKNQRMITRLDRLRTRYYWSPLIVLFFYSIFVPLPNELLVLPLGFMGYHLRHIFPIVLLGNSIFNTLAAFGVISFFNTIG